MSEEKLKQGSHIYTGVAGKQFMLETDDEISPAEFLAVCDAVQAAVRSFYEDREQGDAGRGG
jgi:hypothetical protein